MPQRTSYRCFALAALVATATIAESAPTAAVPQTAPGLGQIAADALSVVAWPVQLDAVGALGLSATGLGTLLLLRADTHLYSRVQRIRWSVQRHSVFDYTIHLGNGFLDLGVVGAFALGDERARRTALTGIEALVSVATTSVLLKHVFRVPRPEVDPSQKRYFQAFHDDALPSGHSMSAFATAAVIGAEYPAAAPFAYAAAALTGLSVMKRAWHWPSDVFMGAGLGVLIGRTSVHVNRNRLSFGPAAKGLAFSGEI